MLRNPISNVELRVEDIPPSDAEWQAIVTFAQTFDGYEEAGSFAEAGKLANRCRQSFSENRAHLTLRQLRICLFFEYRRWNHRGNEPAGDDLHYVQFLLEEIRARVGEGTIE